MTKRLYKALLGRATVQLESLTRSDCPHVAITTIRSLVLDWGTTTLDFALNVRSASRDIMLQVFRDESRDLAEAP